MKWRYRLRLREDSDQYEFITSRGGVVCDSWLGSHSLVTGWKSPCAYREILGWALANDFILFTHDLDFGLILALTKGIGPSVIQLRTPNVRPVQVGGLVVEAIRQFEAELKAGALITVNFQRTRVRILPLTDR